MASIRASGITWDTTSLASARTVTLPILANDLIIVLVGQSGQASVAYTFADQSVGSAGSGTYTQVTTGLTAASVDSFGIYIRNQLTQGSHTAFGVQASALAGTGGGFVVIAVSGMRRAGLAAIRRVAGVLQSAVQSNQGAGTAAPVLPAAALSTNPLIAFLMNATNGSVNAVPRSAPAYTELFDQGYNVPATGIEVMSIDSGETGSTITWGGASPSAFGSAVLELDASDPNIWVPFSMPSGLGLLTPRGPARPGAQSRDGLSKVPLVVVDGSGGGYTGFAGNANALDRFGGVEQPFTPTASWVMTGVDFVTRTVLSPTDSIVVDIVSAYDSVTSLATGSLAASQIRADQRWHHVELASPLTLTSGQQYWMRLTRSGAADSTNYYQILQTLEDRYPGNQWSAQESPSGVWTGAGQGVQLLFMVDGYVPATPVGPWTVIPGQATETDTAQAFTAKKTRAIGQNTETDTAQAFTHKKTATIGQATETDTSQAFTHTKARAIGQNTETDTSQAFTAKKTRAIGQNTETDTAQAFTASKAKTTGQASETDTSQQFLNNPQRRLTGQTTETDTAQAFTAKKTRTIGQATETDTSQAFTASKAKAIGLNTEADTAQAFTAKRIISIGQATETDTARAFTASKTKAIGLNTETDTAQAFSPNHNIAIGQSTETDLARPFTASKATAIGLNTEADTAQAFTAYKTRIIGQASETDTSQTMTPSKARAIAQATETETAQAFTARHDITTGRASETDTAQPITAYKTRSIGRASETDEAQAMTASKARAIGQASETDVAQPFTVSQQGQPHTVAINQVEETDEAQPMGKAKTRAIGQASETSTAQPMGKLKTITIGQATETDEAGGFTRAAGTPQTIVIGQCVEVDVAQLMSHAKARIIGQATETDQALHFTRLITSTLEPDFTLPGSQDSELQLAGSFDTDLVLPGSLDPDVTL